MFFNILVEKRRYIYANQLISQLAVRVYSFTGASISPEVKSISISFFPIICRTCHQPTCHSFSQKTLRDKFVSQTNLDLLPNGGDIRLEGFISDYRTQPVAIQSNSAAHRTD
jgi:hypothetical protein